MHFSDIFSGELAPADHCVQVFSVLQEFRVVDSAGYNEEGYSGNKATETTIITIASWKINSHSSEHSTPEDCTIGRFTAAAAVRPSTTSAGAGKVSLVCLELWRVVQSVVTRPDCHLTSYWNYKTVTWLITGTTVLT